MDLIPYVPLPPCKLTGHLGRVMSVGGTKCLGFLQFFFVMCIFIWCKENISFFVVISKLSDQERNKKKQVVTTTTVY